MRKISADYIYPISSEPIKNGVILVDDNGLIISTYVSSERNENDVEYYEGIICPGFINTHCHLELSHLKGKISPQKGIAGFISEIIPARNQFTDEQILTAIEKAENEMIQSGIVAVGDISNTNYTFHQKARGRLKYHTFIEVFDLNPERAHEVFRKAVELSIQLEKLNQNFAHSIAPHAPYTVSDELFDLIKNHAEKNGSILTIHNQESADENKLFQNKSGSIVALFHKMGIDLNFISKTEKNSLESTFQKLPLNQKILLVHNTFTSAYDIEFLKLKSSNYLDNIFFCTCPNANLFIENKLPDYHLFIKENLTITIGTDSLASNWSLSILDELKTITKHFSEIPLQTLLTWATKNGADYLGFNHLGTIEKGKKPGLNLLKNVNGLKINSDTEVVKII